MIRATDNIVFDTESNFTTFNPVIPPYTVTVSLDTGNMKVGNGSDHWNDLSFMGSSSIGGKYIQSGDPTDSQIVIFDVSSDTWLYRLLGCFDTVTNWQGTTSIFPTYTFLIETDSGTPTGNFKIGDGTTQFNNLPWFGGIHVLTDFATGVTGKSIKWDGNQWIPVEFFDADNLPASSTPTGIKVLYDTGEFAEITNLPKLDAISSDIGVFGTIQVGFPTETTSVTLTSDGNSLFIDGQQVWTEYNDGDGSGLDADTLDGHHYTAFATGPETVTPGHIVTFGASPNILVDSGLDPDTLATTAEFATVGDIESADENALIYSIVMGG